MLVSVLAVKFERADGKEGFVGCVAIAVGVEDRYKFFEFGGGRWEAQSAGDVRFGFGSYVIGSVAYMRADFTSSMGRTPFCSPSMGSEKRLYASLISFSSCAVTLCSLASLDCRGLGAPLPEAAGFRLGGCRILY